MTSTNWYKRFFELAKYIAEWSKYPGRHVGAVIVDDRHTVVSIGYNGNPRGCNDVDPSKYNSSVKYYFAEHAERNAIYNARQPLIGCTLYCTLFPCADCARGIIQTGIKTVITRMPNLEDPDFGGSFKAALKLFDETHVMVYYIDNSGFLINQN